MKIRDFNRSVLERAFITSIRDQALDTAINESDYSDENVEQECIHRLQSEYTQAEGAYSIGDRVRIKSMSPDALSATGLKLGQLGYVVRLKGDQPTVLFDGKEIIWGVSPEDIEHSNEEV